MKNYEVAARLRKMGFEVTGDQLTEVAVRNHLIWRLQDPSYIPGIETYCIRAINPQSHRRGEWLSMREESKVLEALGFFNNNLFPNIPAPWPNVYGVEESGHPALLVQEWVDATCINELKPLTNEHLQAVARAVAKLNTVPVIPKSLPFVARPHESFGASRIKWGLRLAEACARSRMREDVVKWANKLWGLCGEVASVLAAQSSLIRQSPRHFFHFDGAHGGNTYWRDNHIVFLDWQKVSFRRDPTFTLVRFGVSAGKKGQAPLAILDTLVEVYCDAVERNVDRSWFRQLAYARWLEREMSDAVWVLREPFRAQSYLDVSPVDEASSVAVRYNRVTELIAQFS